MGNVMGTASAGEPTNQDAYVFWFNLNQTFAHPDTLHLRFQPFMVDIQNAELEESEARMNAQRSSRQYMMGRDRGGSMSEETYIVTGQQREDGRLSPSSTSRISFANETPQIEKMNRNLLQIINCKLQLIPPELNHITLNLDNHPITERLMLTICATIIDNNERYHNRHMTTTFKDTPINTIRRKRIQSDFDNLITQYYFNITKLSLKKTFLSDRSLEALSQALRTNHSILELDLGGNELMSSGIAMVTAGLRYNKSVTRLNMSDVRAFDEGAFILSAFLMTSKTLRILDLSTNHITDKGFEVLKQATIRNTYISSLYLSDNNIDSTKLYSLSHILNRNSSVQYVFETIFNNMKFNRRFKNKLQSVRKTLAQSQQGGRGDASQDDGDRTPIFKMLGAKGQQAVPEQKPSNRFIIGMSETIGKRPSMEDRMVAYGCYRSTDNCELYCVFDGHGGKSASDYAADNIYRIFGEFLDSKKTPGEAFKLAYQKIHTHISPWPFIGTTAASVYIKDNMVCIANVGDTRVVMGTLNDDHQFVSERLTFDHRPVEDTERKRIISAGGTILNGRVNGMLAVSRALGDSFLTPYVSTDPYIKNITITEKNKFLILACDGVWDLISDEEAVKVISTIPDPAKSSETLRDLAFSQGSTDNISVMIVKLHDY
ncbi:hypothetical protein SAMD00019534_024500 [Acytostelium subglobosum LB1]|uniref:hypothetical protein n=1 Tax=Acytostelium subglobosum LB1 TaxID=1410327 RepID=UPI0006448ABE|nr:hypothetical protein SAMD00019534_024500 [Acytostelium subglobosum LB1]GAM19275.1 hypothetical protein SAMD00019534_024500 [Acytostelium subglobosum LB1]|eukprot:XP_012757202.1 hypothetical protein SAMD00019534_024500 [Acytostelium subglobosum LB1]